MARTRNAFTMIEIIFVIVILGILAIIAVPKLVATRDDARMVVMAQGITTAASEIATYMISQGVAQDDLSLMSASVRSLVNTGDAVVDASNKEVAFKMGDEDSCITMKIVTSGGDENLTIFNTDTTDAACAHLQEAIPEEVYPIALRGSRVVAY